MHTQQARKAQHNTRERYNTSLQKRANMNFRKQMKTLPLNLPLQNEEGGGEAAAQQQAEKATE